MMPNKEDTGNQETKKTARDQEDRNIEIEKQPSTPARRKPGQNKDMKTSILKLTPNKSLKHGGGV